MFVDIFGAAIYDMPIIINGPYKHKNVVTTMRLFYRYVTDLTAKKEKGGILQEI